MLTILNTLDISEVPEVREILEQEAILINVQPVKKEIFKFLHKADIYMSNAAYVVEKELIDYAFKLKLIESPSTGTDHLNLVYLKKKNIKLFEISREYSLLKKFTATSELAFALILSLTRNIIPANQNVLEGYWGREVFKGNQLYDKTLGILGLGRLGKISSKIGKGFGMKVIAYDPNVKKYKDVKMYSLEELLKKCDVLSIHVHLNEETTNLINKERLKLMKNTSILINTSRGKIVDEIALLDCLKNNLIAGAGLDVIDGEWLTDENRINHPLIDYSKKNSNLLIVPHIGGSTKESIKYSRIFIAKKIIKFIREISNK